MSKEKRHTHTRRDPECLRVFEQLSEYLDGDLTPADCRHVEEHIRDCEPCIEFLESLKSSVRLSHELPSTEVPVQLPEHVRTRLRAAWQAALQRRLAPPA